MSGSGPVPVRCDACRSIHMIPHSHIGAPASCHRCGKPLTTMLTQRSSSPAATALATRAHPPVAPVVRATRAAAPAAPASAPARGETPPGAPPRQAARAHARRQRHRNASIFMLVLALLLLGAALFFFDLIVMAGERSQLDVAGLTCEIQGREVLMLEVKRGDAAAGDLRSTLVWRAQCRVRAVDSSGAPQEFEYTVKDHSTTRELTGGAAEERSTDSLPVPFSLVARREGDRFAVALPEDGKDESQPNASAVAAAAVGFHEDWTRGIYSLTGQLRVGETREITGQSLLLPLLPAGDAAFQNGSATVQITGFKKENGRKLANLEARVQIEFIIDIAGEKFLVRASGGGVANLDLQRGVVIMKEETLELSGAAIGAPAGAAPATASGRLHRTWKVDL